MADNYLERQYESYQARKAAWEREKKFGKKKSVRMKPMSPIHNKADEPVDEQVEDENLYDGNFTDDDLNND